MLVFLEFSFHLCRPGHDYKKNSNAALLARVVLAMLLWWIVFTMKLSFCLDVGDLKLNVFKERLGMYHIRLEERMYRSALLAILSWDGFAFSWFIQPGRRHQLLLKAVSKHNKLMKECENGKGTFFSLPAKGYLLCVKFCVFPPPTALFLGHTAMLSCRSLKVCAGACSFNGRLRCASAATQYSLPGQYQGKPICSVQSKSQICPVLIGWLFCQLPGQCSPFSEEFFSRVKVTLCKEF